MTYAASLRLATLARQHTLTENELRAARAQHTDEAVSLVAIERAVADVLATRDAHAA